jgi:hypothetical protein
MPSRPSRRRTLSIQVQRSCIGILARCHQSIYHETIYSPRLYTSIRNDHLIAFVVHCIISHGQRPAPFFVHDRIMLTLRFTVNWWEQCATTQVSSLKHTGTPLLPAALVAPCRDWPMYTWNYDTGPIRQEPYSRLYMDVSGTNISEYKLIVYLSSYITHWQGHIYIFN